MRPSSATRPPLRWLTFALILLSLGAGPATRPSPVTPVAAAALPAKVASLEQQLAAQSAELARLRSEHAEVLRRVQGLEEMLKSSGLLPAATGAQDAKKSLAIVIDVSGSMTTPFPIALRAARSKIASLTTEETFGIITVGEDHVASLQPFLVRADAEQKARADKFLDLLKPSGGGTVAPGLRAAINLQPAEIWLLTDGDDPAGNLLANQVKDANSRKIPISVLPDLASTPETKKALERIATESGGHSITSPAAGAQRP